MLDVLIARLRRRTAQVLGCARSALQSARRPKGVVGGLVADLTRTRSELLVENMMFRQQLIVAARAVKRPKLRTHERGLLVMLTILVPRWRDALLVLMPETILRWHRDGFRLFWKYRSATAKPRTPRIDDQTVALIRRMALGNRW